MLFYQLVLHKMHCNPCAQWEKAQVLLAAVINAWPRFMQTELNDNSRNRTSRVFVCPSKTRPTSFVRMPQPVSRASETLPSASSYIICSTRQILTITPMRHPRRIPGRSKRKFSNPYLVGLGRLESEISFKWGNRLRRIDKNTVESSDCRLRGTTLRQCVCQVGCGLK